MPEGECPWATNSKWPISCARVGASTAWTETSNAAASSWTRRSDTLAKSPTASPIVRLESLSAAAISGSSLTPKWVGSRYSAHSVSSGSLQLFQTAIVLCACLAQLRVGLLFGTTASSQKTPNAPSTWTQPTWG